MREAWSVNALSAELGPDRRTLTKWLARAGVKPAEDGPNGPLFKLGDVVAVLADAQLVGNPERLSRWRSAYQAERAVCGLTKRLLRALAKRLPDDTQRAVREALAEELLAALERSDRETFAERPEQRGVLPEGGWSALSDRDLARRLRLLVEIGRVEEAR